jgi:small GTP-binding protein
MILKQCYKVSLIGDHGVGKTSIIHSELSKCFQDQSPTVGGNSFRFSVQILDSVNVILNVWDTAGQEQYRSLIPTYIRGSDAVLLVASIDNQDSINNLVRWKQFVKDKMDVPMICTFNKIDLSPNLSNCQRSILQRFKDDFSSIHFVSAKTNEFIKDLFAEIAKTIIFKNQNEKVTVLNLQDNHDLDSCHC